MRIVATLTVCAALLAACIWKVNRNHFVVPKGYTGPLAVVSDSSFSGKSGHWDGEQYVHLVPRTAVVCIVPGDRLRSFSAEYSDGAPIYSYGAGRVHPPNSDAIRIEGFGSWGGSIEGSYVDWFGIGDADTVEALKRSFFGDGIERRMPEGVHMHNFDIKDYKYMGPHCATQAPTAAAQGR